ncbi:MAG: hypothetical protein ACLPV8_28055 [Steroidobacteraceae bacterium]
MATRSFIIATLSLALFPLGSALAQVTPPPPPGVAPSPPGAVAAPVVTGRIKTLLMNPNGDIDGLLLTDDTQVNFPPHLSEALLQIARIGDTVSVQGFRGYGAGVLHATVITNTSSGRSMIDEPPAPDRQPPPLALTAITASGHVSQLLHADMGEVNGALLDDGTIVRFPPPFGVQLQNVLQPNVQLTATGFGTQKGLGRALEATSLAINGQAAISVYGPGPAPGTARLPPAPGVAPQPR